MELLLLYLWMKLNVVPWVLIPLILLSGLFGLIAGLTHHDDATWRKSWEELSYQQRADTPWPKWIEEQRKTSIYLKAFNRCKWVFLCALGLLIVVPSQTQTAVLVAGHYALRMADSPEASKVLQVLRKKANEYLDEELKEVKK